MIRCMGELPCDRGTDAQGLPSHLNRSKQICIGEPSEFAEHPFPPNHPSRHKVLAGIIPSKLKLGIAVPIGFLPVRGKEIRPPRP